MVLAKVLRITVVSDRESDIYEDFALKPENVLIRASANRNLVNGEKLFGYAFSLPEVGRIYHTWVAEIEVLVAEPFRGLKAGSPRRPLSK